MSTLPDAGEAGHHPARGEDGHRARGLPLDIEEDGEAGPLGPALEVGLAPHQEAGHTVSQVPGAAD